MASGNKTLKLYWCTTDDHDEDWFIFANSARLARSFHEHYEGYGKGDASSRLIVSQVTLEKFMNGTPPCHAQFQDLFQIGFRNAGGTPNRRKVRLFHEVILESIVELGRQQLAETMRVTGCGRKEVESARADTENAPGVEARPRLVG